MIDAHIEHFNALSAVSLYSVQLYKCHPKINHPEEDGFPFDSGFSQGFFLKASQGVFFLAILDYGLLIRSINIKIHLDFFLICLLFKVLYKKI